MALTSTRTLSLCSKLILRVRKDPITAIVGFRLYHNTVYIEDFEMDNVDLLNIDIGALGPDWKSRSYSSQKSDLIYIFHTCPLPIWL